MVNSQDSCGATPLMDAARAGHLDIVKIVISSSDLGIRDTLGRGVVQVSAQAGVTQILQYLR